MFQLAPKTKQLIDLFAGADYGDSFTYAEILRETDCDVTGPDRGRVYSAVRVLEREHQKTLTNQRGRGYLVTPPEQFKHEIEGRIRSAGKHMVRAKHTGSAAPLMKLNDFERRELVAVQAHVAVLDQQIRGMNKRVARLEKILGVEEPATIDGQAVEEAA